MSDMHSPVTVMDIVQNVVISLQWVVVVILGKIVLEREKK